MAGIFLFELQHSARTRKPRKLWDDHFHTECYSGGWHELCLFSQFPLRHSGTNEVKQRSYLEADILVKWFPEQKYFAVGITSAGAAVGMMNYVSSLIPFPLTKWQAALPIHWRSAISLRNMVFPPALGLCPQSLAESLLSASSADPQIQQRRGGQ